LLFRYHQIIEVKLWWERFALEWVTLLINTLFDVLTKSHSVVQAGTVCPSIPLWLTAVSIWLYILIRAQTCSARFKNN
jgi:hypothetical protein